MVLVVVAEVAVAEVAEVVADADIENHQEHWLDGGW